MANINDEIEIKRLNDQNDSYFQKISFNNTKLMVLNGEGEQVILEYIDKHYDQWKDESEKELLLTYLKSKRNGNS